MVIWLVKTNKRILKSPAVASERGGWAPFPISGRLSIYLARNRTMSPRECNLIPCQPFPKGAQPYPLPAPPRGSAALSSSSPSPRKCSLIPCQPFPKGVQPYRSPASPSPKECSLILCQPPPGMSAALSPANTLPDVRRATLPKLPTGVLFKLFNAQFLHFVILKSTIFSC